MSRPRRQRRAFEAVRRRLTAERGFVLPVAVQLIAIGLMLAAVGIASAMELSNASNGDRRAKQAIGAADAGVQTALYRLNSLQLNVDDLTSVNPCIVPAINASGVATALSINATLDVNATAWCAESGSEKTGNEGSFSYQISPTAAAAAKLGVGATPAVAVSLDRKVVVKGKYTAPGGKTVTRRVLARFAALDGTNLLNPDQGGYAVVATNGLTMNDTSPAIGLTSKHAGVLSGAGITRNAGAICGDSAYYSGSAPTLNCSGVNVQQSDDAQAITSQLTNPDRPAAAIRRYTPANCVALLGCSGPGGSSPGTVTISNALSILPNIPAGEALDVCQLNISAGQLVGRGTSSNPSYIYVEPPNTNGCGSTTGINITGTGQFCQTAVSLVELCTSAVGLTDPRALQILLGPGAQVTFDNSLAGSTLPSYAVINGPNANVTIQGGSSLYGGVIGKNVTLAGSGQVQSSPTVNLKLNSLVSLPLPLLPIYKLKSFKECTPTAPTASDPTSGC